MDKPPFTRSQRMILQAQVSLAVIFVIVGFIDTSGADGWSDLARLVTVVLAGVYLLAVATVTAIARYATSATGTRTALVVLGPPALMVIAFFVIRAA